MVYVDGEPMYLADARKTGKARETSRWYVEFRDAGGEIADEVPTYRGEGRTFL